MSLYSPAQGNLEKKLEYAVTIILKDSRGAELKLER